MSITFATFVGLAVAGTDAPDTVRGVVREVDEQGERLHRIARDGYLVRVEELSGAVVHIIGREATWTRHDGRIVRHLHERSVNVLFAGAPIGGLRVGGERSSWSRWDGADFTRPTGPVQDTGFLGRAAYVVELAPPAHKPYPLEITIDAGTGVVLRSANAGFRAVREWTELEIGASLPPELFTWDGPCEDEPTDRDPKAEYEADMAAGRAWLTARGIADLFRPAGTEISLHERDDADGSFYASINASLSGTLLRRPSAEAPAWADADELQYAHTYRWSDVRWDWCLALDVNISDESLAALKQRLAAST